MNKISLLLLSLCLSIAACGGNDPGGNLPAATEETSTLERGPHNGRLLTDGDVVVELAIFEEGVPPEFRAWITQRGQPLSPEQVDLAVTLTRLGGELEEISFAPSGTFLRGTQSVHEPHSFDVTVTARVTDHIHTWSYASYEGRTVIAADVANDAGVETDIAGAGTIAETLALYGTISPDRTRVREIRARYPGVIRSATKQVGDAVRAGETLATIEANESLQEYAVTAPISGVITERHAEPGEQTGDDSLFEIADFSRVWAEFNAFPRDRSRLQAGLRAQVFAEGGEGASGTISYLASTGNAQSQSVVVRVVLDNSQRRWTPGQFVEGRVTLSETPVALVVPLSALQTFRDFTVVFALVDDTYEVRMLELGRRDSEQVEVVGGLAAGTRYVTRNSYLIKADIEKSGASHDH